MERCGIEVLTLTESSTITPVDGSMGGQTTWACACLKAVSNHEQHGQEPRTKETGWKDHRGWQVGGYGEGRFEMRVEFDF